MKKKFENGLNLSHKNGKRQQLEVILSSNDEYSKVFRKIKELYDIQLEIGNDDILFEFIKRNEDLNENLINFIQQVLDPPRIIQHENGVIKVKSYTIFISDIINDVSKIITETKNICEIQFTGVNIFMDSSFTTDTWKGMNLSVAADVVEFLEKVDINLSGKNGRDGMDGKSQLNATRYGENGLSGLPGENGEAGESGKLYTL